MKPLFSALHASARPRGWQKAYAAWQHKKSPGCPIEWLLTVDAGREEEFLDAAWPDLCLDRLGHLRKPAEDIQLITNWGRRSCVAAYNRAAELAQGQIFILMSDDMFPPQDWDLGLLAALARAGKEPGDDFVFMPSTGSADDEACITLQIMGAKRWQRQGFCFWPGYPSVWADREFTEKARLDGALVPALDVKFEHENPYLGKGQWDEIYAWENRERGYIEGRALFEERQAKGFPGLPWMEDRARDEKGFKWLRPPKEKKR